MSPDQFLLFADPLPEAMLLLSGDGCIQAGNQSAVRQFAGSAGGLCGRQLSDLADGPSQQVDRYLQLCRRSRNLVLGSLQLREASGKLVPCRLEGALLRPKEDGSPALLSIRIRPKNEAAAQFVTLNQRIEELAIEVRRRRRAEELARQQEEALRVTLYSIGDGVISTDAQGRVVMMNSVAESLTGWRQAEAVGQPLEQVFQIINEDSRQATDNPALRALQKGTIVNLANHTLLIAKSGQEFPIMDSAAPIRDPRGELMGSVLVFRDVSESRRAERKLSEANRRFAAVFNQQFQFMAILNPEGTVVDANDVSFDTTGFEREQIIGLPIWQAPWWQHSQALRQRWQHIVAAVGAGEGPLTADVDYSLADGTVRLATVVITPLKDDSGRVTNILLEGRDDTQRKRSEKVLQAQKKALELLVNGAALPDVLDALCEVIEIDSSPKAIATILLLDESGKTLRTVAGRRAPAGYCQAIDGLQIGPGEGSCGTAAFTGQQTVVADIASHPFWVNFRDVALSHGLRACWSTPIISSRGTVVGTFAVYYQTPAEPSGEALQFVDILTRTAGLAIERHRAEMELVQSEKKLQLLANSIPQLAWMAQPDGNIFWYNRRWYEYTGTKPEDMQGWGWSAVHDPEVLPQVLQRWRASLTSGEPFDMVFPLKGADGKFRPFLTRVNPFRDAENRILYWFGTNTDVSELREARQALAANEERLRLALVAGRMGVWDWNIRTGELNWSDSLEPLHGLEPGTFGGTFEHFQQLIHPEDRARVNRVISEAVEREGEFEAEFRNVWPNGTVHWIIGTGKVFVNDDGQSERMIGVGMDVTQRKRTEQTTRFLADASAALAVLVDFDSTLQKVASLAVPHFADWVAVDVLEPNGDLRRVAVSHVDPDKVRLARELHERFPTQPDAPSGNWNILRTGQSELVPQISNELLQESLHNPELVEILGALGLKSYIGVPLNVRGKPLGVLTFVMAESAHVYDATDLAVAQDLASRAAIAIENAQLYRELQIADRRKDEFIATLAHELRNPLAPIRNGLEVIRLIGTENELVADARIMMERQLCQMVRLVDDLLDVSRITRNKLELRMERVSLAAVVHSAVETSRPLFEQAGHTFSLTLPSTPVYLHADAVRLAQVLANLLNNSAKYTEPGGRISLTVTVSGEEVAISVRDNGLGIPAEALVQIFEMFSQVDQNMERAQGGLGIGLTLVKRLVEMHGGTVCVTSEGHRRGSEFIVRLPLLKHESQEPQKLQSSNGTPVSQKRILVVDDNRDSTVSLSMMLKLMGNETRAAHDGLEAIEAAEDFRPDIILLDIGLPKLNGYDACRQIRKQAWSADIVIIALTGWGQEEDRRRSAEAGFNHHLVKPVDLLALEKILGATSVQPAPSTGQLPSPDRMPAGSLPVGEQDGLAPGDVLRVLVVDDRRDARHMLATLLTMLGHRVETADDGPSALEMARDTSPDVILLDINLPGLSGLEVAAQLRSQPDLQQTVLIAMTGYGEEEHRQRSYAAGFDHHLTKPADIRTIREILATVQGNRE